MSVLILINISLCDFAALFLHGEWCVLLAGTLVIVEMFDFRHAFALRQLGNEGVACFYELGQRHTRYHKTWYVSRTKFCYPVTGDSTPRNNG